MCHNGFPFCVGSLELVSELGELVSFDCILVSMATTSTAYTVGFRGTLTIQDIWTLAFTSDEPHVELVGSFLLHFYNHKLAAPASRFDRDDMSIHDVVFVKLQGFNGQGVQTSAVMVALPRPTLRRVSSTRNTRR